MEGEISPDLIMSDLDSIPQYDGNTSTSSFNDSFTPQNHIPTQIGFRPLKENLQRLHSVTVTVPRSRKLAKAQSLPIAAVYNARSLFPKLESLIINLNERLIDVCCVSEIWENKEKKIY